MERLHEGMGLFLHFLLASFPAPGFTFDILIGFIFYKL